jgi:hypothetical protein
MLQFLYVIIVKEYKTRWACWNNLNTRGINIPKIIMNTRVVARISLDITWRMMFTIIVVTYKNVPCSQVISFGKSKGTDKRNDLRKSCI